MTTKETEMARTDARFDYGSCNREAPAFPLANVADPAAYNVSGLTKLEWAAATILAGMGPWIPERDYGDTRPDIELRVESAVDHAAALLESLP